LVIADYPCLDTPREPDRADPRFSGGAVYLHTLLACKLARIPAISGA